MQAAGASDKVALHSESPVVTEIRDTHQRHQVCCSQSWEGGLGTSGGKGQSWAEAKLCFLQTPDLEVQGPWGED